MAATHARECALHRRAEDYRCSTAISGTRDLFSLIVFEISND
jgi:hypothetical protein